MSINATADSGNVLEKASVELVENRVIDNALLNRGSQEFLCFRQEGLEGLDLRAGETEIDEPKHKRDNSGEDPDRARYNTKYVVWLVVGHCGEDRVDEQQE